MCRHPAPSKPKPQGGRSLASPDPGDCRHTASSIPEPAQRVLLCWDCHPSLGRTGPRVLGRDLLVQPRSSASQTRHAGPLPCPGCLLGTEDAQARLGFPVFPARAEMCQGSHTWPGACPAPRQQKLWWGSFHRTISPDRPAALNVD